MIKGAIKKNSMKGFYSKIFQKYTTNEMNYALRHPRKKTPLNLALAD
jgi:hypothetical protein